MKPTLAFLRKLVGNPLVYAIQQEDGSWRPVRAPLTDGVLLKHLSCRHTVGTYVGHRRDGTTVARTLVVDIDSGDPEELAAVKQAFETLGLGPRYVGVEASGRKGWHVWLVLQDYVPSRELRRVGRLALAIAGVSCELFPKQDEVKNLGNLVKLPGSKHRVTGQRNDFLGPLPAPIPSSVWTLLVEGLPKELSSSSGAGGDVERPAYSNRFPCLEAIQAGVKEGGRNNCMFHLATMCRRHGLTDDSVAAVLRATNAKNEPPLDYDELETIIETSRNSGPICGSLPAELQEACGDHCIKVRLGKLMPRPGQLRHADVGEAVVVRVEGRAGPAISLGHMDLETRAKGRLHTGGADGG